MVLMCLLFSWLLVVLLDFFGFLAIGAGYTWFGLVVFSFGWVSGWFLVFWAVCCY